MPKINYSILTGILLILSLAPIESEASETNDAERSIIPLFERISYLVWTPQKGDSLLIDTKDNYGYLIHLDGRYFRFALVTGQRKYVCYIGLCYDASTPNWKWKAMQKEIKGDRITFGPSGRFIRLLKDGTEHTSYGIHEYKYEDRIFESPGRFGSMGCIVVRKPVMDLIERTFDINEGGFEVVTQFGIGDEFFVMR